MFFVAVICLFLYFWTTFSFSLLYNETYLQVSNKTDHLYVGVDTTRINLFTSHGQGGGKNYNFAIFFKKSQNITKCKSKFFGRVWCAVCNFVNMLTHETVAEMFLHLAQVTCLDDLSCLNFELILPSIVSEFRFKKKLCC